MSTNRVMLSLAAASENSSADLRDDDFQEIHNKIQKRLELWYEKSYLHHNHAYLCSSLLTQFRTAKHNYQFFEYLQSIDQILDQLVTLKMTNQNIELTNEHAASSAFNETNEQTRLNKIQIISHKIYQDSEQLVYTLLNKKKFVSETDVEPVRLLNHTLQATNGYVTNQNKKTSDSLHRCIGQVEETMTRTTYKKICYGFKLFLAGLTALVTIGIGFAPLPGIQAVPVAGVTGSIIAAAQISDRYNAKETYYERGAKLKQDLEELRTVENTSTFTPKSR